MRVLLFMLLVIGVSVAPARSADRVMGPVRAEVLRVVDGDTISVRALIWPGQRVEVKVRLANIDAPELYRPACAQEKQLAKTATVFVEQIGTMVELRDIRFGKYAGRVVAEVRTESGEDLGDLLLAAGLATRSSEKTNWCENSKNQPPTLALMAR